jgi:hypothetical protein
MFSGCGRLLGILSIITGRSKKLLGPANAMQADHAGRLSVEMINRQFRDAGGSYEDFYETGRYAAQYSSDPVRIR